MWCSVVGCRRENVLPAEQRGGHSSGLTGSASVGLNSHQNHENRGPVPCDQPGTGSRCHLFRPSARRLADPDTYLMSLSCLLPLGAPGRGFPRNTQRGGRGRLSTGRYWNPSLWSQKAVGWGSGHLVYHMPCVLCGKPASWAEDRTSGGAGGPEGTVAPTVQAQRGAGPPGFTSRPCSVSAVGLGWAVCPRLRHPEVVLEAPHTGSGMKPAVPQEL